jgi:hypothetical protein
VIGLTVLKKEKRQRDFETALVSSWTSSNSSRAFPGMSSLALRIFMRQMSCALKGFFLITALATQTTSSRW